MITCKEDLYGTYVLNNNTGAIELYLSLINKFGISNNIKEIEESALALEVCRQGDKWVALWIVHSLSALDSKSIKLTLSDLKQEGKPRTKVEYVKVNDSIFDLKDDFEGGLLYSKHKSKDKYYQINTELWVVSAMNNNNLYRRIETPMTEREAFIEAAVSELENGMSDKDYAEALFNSGKFKLVN